MFRKDSKRIAKLEEASDRHEADYAALKSEMSTSFDRIDDMYEMIRAWLLMSGLVYLAVNEETGIVKYAFGAWTKLGWSDSELIGRPIFDFIHPDDQDRTADELHERPDVYDDDGVVFTNRYRCKTGGYATIEWFGKGGDKVRDLAVGAGRVKLRAGHVAE